MIEAKIIEFLSMNLDVPVSTEIPDHDIDEFVIIEKTGSSHENHIDSCTIAVQSYGATYLEAALLNERVKKVLYRLTELPIVFRANVETDYNFTDEESKRYRYQAVLSLTFKEE